jgi:hypothetical protein
MAESISLKKRLIGKEDINFDIAGTGETENFFTSDGGQKVLTKINASHFPLTRSSREKLNATNVDEALNLISDKVDNFEANDALTEDVTVSFLQEDDIETIQNKINQQKKNLNGHTISFLFPVSLAQNLYSTLIWQDFYNGTVVIAGGTDGSRIAIYDKQDINALFKIYRCQCEVRIEYFHFVHQYSIYAVSAESSSAVILKGCQFSGMAGASSAAVHHINSSHTFIGCEFYEDEKSDPAGYLPLTGGTMTGDIVFGSGNSIKLDDNTKNLNLFAGTSWQDSSHIIIRGANLPQDDPNYDARGQVLLVACREDGEQSRLYLLPDGTMRLNEKQVELVDSIGSNYIRYTSGLQICWGQARGGTTVTLPQSFVSYDYQISLTDVGQDKHSGGAGNKTTTTFYIFGGSGVYFHWIAIGKWK